jgi:hypothetical protein
VKWRVSWRWAKAQIGAVAPKKKNTESLITPKLTGFSSSVEYTGSNL